MVKVCDVMQATFKNVCKQCMSFEGTACSCLRVWFPMLHGACCLL